MFEPSVRVLLVGGLPNTPLLKERLAAVAQNMEITTAGPEALECLGNSPFDIALLDIPFSDTTRIEVLRANRSRQLHMPILWLSNSPPDAPELETSGNEPAYMVESRENPQAIVQAIRYSVLRNRHEKTLHERTEDLRDLNRTLEMITDCSKDIVRATSEEELLEDICREIVNVGAYQFAWIGFARNDPAKTILPVAQAGQAGVCLKKIRSSWVEDDWGTSAGEAIRSGAVSIRRGFQKNLKGQAQCGYCSSIALPLRKQDEIFGALVICSSKQFAFDEAHVPILQELAEDLAFGVAALRTRAELAAALQDLEQQSLQLRALAVELTQAEERERKRLAQAIHDDLQQLLVACKFCADTLAGGIKTLSLQETALQLNDFLNQAIESARSLSFELSPPILHNTGLAKALHYLARRMEVKHGLTVKVHTVEDAEPQSEELRILLFQSARELLFNVVKHAGVKTAEIDLRRFKEDHVQIMVSDSGVGFDPATCASEISQNGFGLFSIRGRLDLMGGRLDIQSSPGAGSRFIMTVPLNKAALPDHSKPKCGLLRAGHRTPRNSRKSK